jgi:predicted AlkP superfamily phosphohydrolase/phosphomutase
MTGRETPERAFVLGLDGVPWKRLRAWAEAGELPNFAALIEEGAAGPLTSTKPANTALAWPSIATGVWPDKHGVYAFHGLRSDYRHRVNTSEDVARPALWEMLSPATVVNVPMSYPAGDIEGTMVTGMMTPERNERFTQPPEFATEIERRIPEYDIGLSWRDYEGSDEEFVADLDSLVEARTELLKLLMDTEDWRLFFFTYTAPDRLQHLLWDEEVLIEHYRQLDAVLGEVREYADDCDANLFVVSDHGFGPVSKTIHINTLLAREGYLTPKTDSTTRGTLSRLGITKSHVLDALGRIGIDDRTIMDHLPHAVVDAVATQIPGEHGLYDVEYDETTAFFHGYGNIHINDERFEEGIVSADEKPALKRELETVFRDLTDPETGERVLDVYDGDELFPTDEDSPDLVVVPRDEYHTKGTLAEEVFTDAAAHAGEHRPEGVFLASGPDIEAGVTPNETTVVDVAPTLLHSIGKAIPADTDGRVLDELFAPDSETAKRSVATTDYARSAGGSSAAEDDFSDVEERLRGLGYVE